MKSDLLHIHLYLNFPLILNYFSDLLITDHGFLHYKFLNMTHGQEIENYLRYLYGQKCVEMNSELFHVKMVDLVCLPLCEFYQLQSTR